MFKFSTVIFIVFFIVVLGQVCVAQKPKIVAIDDISFEVDGNKISGMIFWQKGSFESNEAKGYIYLTFGEGGILQNFVIKDMESGDMICSNPLSIPGKKPDREYGTDEFSYASMSGSLFYIFGNKQISVEKQPLLEFGKPRDPMDMTLVAGRAPQLDLSEFDFE